MKVKLQLVVLAQKAKRLNHVILFGACLIVICVQLFNFRVRITEKSDVYFRFGKTLMGRFFLSGSLHLGVEHQITQHKRSILCFSNVFIFD